MNNKKINIRVRLIIIKQEKCLMSYVKDENFYFYIGGKVDYRETVEQGCIREVKEECNANFTFKKILYIRDYIKPELDEHSVELYILGDIDKYEEVEGLIDPEFPDNHFQTWIELSKLHELDVRPKELTKRLLMDYENGFQSSACYLGEID